MIPRLNDFLKRKYRNYHQRKSCETYKKRILSGEQVTSWLHCEFTFDEIHKILVQRFSSAPIRIFDVGAHRGESIDRFRKLFPDSTIHAFEPNTEIAAFLRQRYAKDSSVILNAHGLGAFNGDVQFYKNVKSDTSSCLPINTFGTWAASKATQQGVSREQLTEEVTQIPIQTIDHYVEVNQIKDIDILKIDTQGYEIECLKGAQKSLESGNIMIIEVEIIVGDAYAKSSTFGEIENLIHNHGYKFFGINGSGNLLSRPHQSFDLLYTGPKVNNLW